MLKRSDIINLLENKGKISSLVLDCPREAIVFQGDISHLVMTPEDIQTLASHFVREGRNEEGESEKGKTKKNKKAKARNAPRPSADLLYLLVLAANLTLYFRKTKTGDKNEVREKQAQEERFDGRFLSYYRRSCRTADVLGKLQLDYFMAHFYFEYGCTDTVICYYKKVMESAHALFPHAISYEQLREFAMGLAAAHFSRADESWQKASLGGYGHAACYYGAMSNYVKMIAMMEKVLACAPDHGQEALYALINQGHCGIARVNFMLAHYHNDEKARLSDFREATRLYLEAIGASINGLKVKGRDEETTACLEMINTCYLHIRRLLLIRREALLPKHKASIGDYIVFMRDYLQQNPDVSMAKQLRKIIRLTEEELSPSPLQPVVSMHSFWQPSPEDKENQPLRNNKIMVLEETSERKNQMK